MTSVFVALVRGVLRFSPRAFRERYASEIISAVEAAVASARVRRGHLGAALLGMRCVSDAVGVVWRERRLTRAVGRLGTRSTWRGETGQVIRSLRRAPAFSLTVVLTLSLSLGLAAAMFSFADGYLFRPLPFPGADRLFFVREPQAPIAAALRATDTAVLRESPLGELGFVEWNLAASVRGPLIVADRAIDVLAYEVTAGFRRTIPLPLDVGRDFTDQDHLGASGRMPVWLSRRFWQREFGGDRGIVGRVLHVGVGPARREIEVAGVLGAEVTSFDLNNPPPDMVLPSVETGPPAANRLSFPIVRLPDGIARHVAEAQINAILQAAAPGPNGRARAVQLRPVREYQVQGGQPTARVLFAGALLLVLLAAINLLHLLLSRNASRASEAALRAALGASRWRLARLYLVESALLGSVGIAGGVALGHWLSALIALRVPRFPTGGRNLSLVPILFDTRVVLFAVALGALVVVVGTCIPAWLALRKPLMSRSHVATAVASGLPMRPTQLILAAELMVATVILVGAVFMGTGIWRYLNAPLGFDYANRLDLSFTMAEPRRPTAVEVDAVVRAVRQVGGVRMAAPYGGAAVRGLEVPGQSVDPQTVSAQSVSAGYGETWGVRVRRGRWFDPAEFTEHAAVVIVDEKFVRTVWPAGEPLGQVIKVAGGPPRQVIGVIEPMRWRLDLEVPGQAFVPAASPPTRADLVVWAPGAPVDLARRLDAAVSQALPGATTSVSPVTFDRLFQRSVGEAQFQAPIMAVFGLFAFVLAGVGVFGIVSYLVAQRIREFGIRLALGAGPRDLWRGVVRQSLVPAGIGLAVGVPAAWALERVVRSAAFGWPSTGIGAAVTVAILLFGITVIAAAAPARRAMSVDPVQVLRAE